MGGMVIEIWSVYCFKYFQRRESQAWFWLCKKKDGSKYTDASDDVSEAPWGNSSQKAWTTPSVSNVRRRGALEYAQVKSYGLGHPRRTPHVRITRMLHWTLRLRSARGHRWIRKKRFQHRALSRMSPSREKPCEIARNKRGTRHTAAVLSPATRSESVRRNGTSGQTSLPRLPRRQQFSGARIPKA